MITQTRTGNISGTSLIVCNFLTALLVCILISIGKTTAQEQRVSFNETNTTVKKALSEIQRQTQLGIAYSNTKFNAEREVVLPSGDMSLSDALQGILHGSRYTYKLFKDVITISEVQSSTPDLSLVQPVNEKHEEPSADTPNDSKFHFEKVNPVIIIEPPLVNNVGVPRSIEYPVYFPVQHYSVNQGSLPRVVLKTNALYGAVAYAPNLMVEIGLANQYTLNISGSYNGWDREGNFNSNKKLVHSVFKIEGRYWLCERFDGHFLGAHLLFAKYNVGSHNIPLLFKKQYRYDGNAYGAGISYGYHLMLGKRWGVEFSTGLGYAYMDYKRHDCSLCERDYIKSSKHYFGPTTAAISLVFIIK